MNPNTVDALSAPLALLENRVRGRYRDTPATKPREKSSGDRAAEPRNVLLVFDSSWEDSRAILMGVAKFAKRRWDVFVDTEAAATRPVWWESPQAWDGVITRHLSPFMIAECRRLRLPVVDLSDSPPIRDIAKVRPDNFSVGRIAAEHLMSLGFRNFAFCGSAEPWSLEREVGFRETLSRAGSDCRVFAADSEDAAGPDDRTRQTGAMATWLAGLPVPVGVMACNDAKALQLLAASRIAGRSVPGEIGILGVNNDHLRCAFSSPSLSSVATDLRLAGHKAAEVLDRMIAARVVSSVDEFRIAPIQVVGRQSTDALAIGDSAVRLALRFIRECAGHGITVADVVAKVGVDRHRLERRFRQAIGRSPHAEIRLTRIFRIKQLLIESDLPLKRISSEVGVPHAEYMNVMFRRLTGMTPGAFRRLHRTRHAAAVTLR